MWNLKLSLCWGRRAEKGWEWKPSQRFGGELLGAHREQALLDSFVLLRCLGERREKLQCAWHRLFRGRIDILHITLKTFCGENEVESRRGEANTGFHKVIVQWPLSRESEGYFFCGRQFRFSEKCYILFPVYIGINIDFFFSFPENTTAECTLFFLTFPASCVQIAVCLRRLLSNLFKTKTEKRNGEIQAKKLCAKSEIWSLY